MHLVYSQVLGCPIESLYTWNGTRACSRNPNLRERISTFDLLVLTCADQQLLIILDKLS
jgi:hypothetical protein